MTSEADAARPGSPPTQAGAAYEGRRHPGAALQREEGRGPGADRPRKRGAERNAAAVGAGPPLTGHAVSLGAD